MVDPRIPYTSHNFSACIAWRSLVADPAAVVPAVVEIAARFLERVCPPAANPELGVAVPPDLPEGSGRRERLVEFGRRAKREVLVTATARTPAAETGVHLSGYGGTQDGVLGALAAAGLHLSGGDGLFLFMPGIREISGDMTAGRLLDLVSIDQVRDYQRQELRRASSSSSAIGYAPSCSTALRSCWSHRSSSRTGAGGGGSSRGRWSRTTERRSRVGLASAARRYSGQVHG